MAESLVSVGNTTLIVLSGCYRCLPSTPVGHLASSSPRYNLAAGQLVWSPRSASPFHFMPLHNLLINILYHVPSLLLPQHYLNIHLVHLKPLEVLKIPNQPTMAETLELSL